MNPPPRFLVPSRTFLSELSVACRAPERVLRSGEAAREGERERRMRGPSARAESPRRIFCYLDPTMFEDCPLLAFAASVRPMELAPIQAIASIPMKRSAPKMAFALSHLSNVP